MIGGSTVETALRHDRILVLPSLLVVVILSWAYLLTGTDTMQEMGSMLMSMSSGSWTLDYAILMLIMRAVMMRSDDTAERRADDPALRRHCVRSSRKEGTGNGIEHFCFGVYRDPDRIQPGCCSPNVARPSACDLI